MKFERIRNLREDNDYKQVQLANYLCVKQSTYSDYESGMINIPIEALMKLADFYNTSVDFIVGRTDEIKSYPKK
ncbi:MAG: helix-turn-helix domain-containing protein [Oscillospiraceae bacterium]|nr:helix-turn-helix domain-containing protein [Oscillospiraceae bacterium]